MRIVTTGGGLRTRPRLRAMVALTLGLAIGWIAVLPLSYFRTYLGRAIDAPPLVQIPRSDAAVPRPQVSADIRRDPANAAGPASAANKSHARRLAQNTTPKPIKTSMIAPSPIRPIRRQPHRSTAPALTAPSLSAPQTVDVAVTDTARRSDPAVRPMPFPESRPETLAGWTVREVNGSTAILDGPERSFKAARGDIVPGVGRLEFDRALGRSLDRRHGIGIDLDTVKGWRARRRPLHVSVLRGRLRLSSQRSIFRGKAISPPRSTSPTPWYASGGFGLLKPQLDTMPGVKLAPTREPRAGDASTPDLRASGSSPRTARCASSRRYRRRRCISRRGRMAGADARVGWMMVFGGGAALDVGPALAGPKPDSAYKRYKWSYVTALEGYRAVSTFNSSAAYCRPFIGSDTTTTRPARHLAGPDG